MINEEWGNLATAKINTLVTKSNILAVVSLINSLAIIAVGIAVIIK